MDGTSLVAYRNSADPVRDLRLDYINLFPSFVHHLHVWHRCLVRAIRFTGITVPGTRPRCNSSHDTVIILPVLQKGHCAALERIPRYSSSITTIMLYCTPFVRCIWLAMRGRQWRDLDASDDRSTYDPVTQDVNLVPCLAPNTVIVARIQTGWSKYNAVFISNMSTSS